MGLNTLDFFFALIIQFYYELWAPIRSRIFFTVCACRIPLFFVGTSFRFNSRAIPRNDSPRQTYCRITRIICCSLGFFTRLWSRYSHPNGTWPFHFWGQSPLRSSIPHLEAERKGDFILNERNLPVSLPSVRGSTSRRAAGVISAAFLFQGLQQTEDLEVRPLQKYSYVDHIWTQHKGKRQDQVPYTCFIFA